MNLNVSAGRTAHCVTMGEPSMNGVPRMCRPCQCRVIAPPSSK